MMHSGIDQGAELIRVFSFPAVDPMRQPVREDRDIPQDDLLGCRQRLQHDDALCFLFAREEEGVRTGICAFQHVSFHISWKDHVRRMRAFDDAADLGWHGVQRHLAEPDERHLRQLGSDLDEVKDPFALKWQTDTDDALSALQMEMCAVCSDLSLIPGKARKVDPVADRVDRDGDPISFQQALGIKRRRHDAVPQLIDLHQPFLEQR